MRGRETGRHDGARSARRRRSTLRQTSPNRRAEIVSADRAPSVASRRLDQPLPALWRDDVSASAATRLRRERPNRTLFLEGVELVTPFENHVGRDDRCAIAGVGHLFRTNALAEPRESEKSSLRLFHRRPSLRGQRSPIVNLGQRVVRAGLLVPGKEYADAGDTRVLAGEFALAPVRRHKKTPGESRRAFLWPLSL